ncbi:hypothetical protein J2Z48_002841 [Croceifilum oryzae]|uniref:Uncharacterized protein n=1 Tax=Croceifilum oryzae TaxID=1553429 RepID=A0AAJ1TGW0_9BACL|nr:hypothetical protein [Croceifilum oryzae]
MGLVIVRIQTLIEQGGNRGEVLYHQASEIPRWDGQGIDRGI